MYAGASGSSLSYMSIRIFASSRYAMSCACQVSRKNSNADSGANMHTRRSGVVSDSPRNTAATSSAPNAPRAITEP